jgi:hypothetical protein
MTFENAPCLHAACLGASMLHASMPACVHASMSAYLNGCALLSGTSLLDGLAARRANCVTKARDCVTKARDCVTKARPSSAQKWGVNTQEGEGGGGGGVTGSDAGGRVGDWEVGQGGYEERLLRDAVLSSPWLWEDRFHISIIISYLNINFLRNNDFHTMGG